MSIHSQTSTISKENQHLYYVVSSPWAWVLEELEECTNACNSHADRDENLHQVSISHLGLNCVTAVSSVSLLPSSILPKDEDSVSTSRGRRGPCTLRIEIVERRHKNENSNCDKSISSNTMKDQQLNLGEDDEIREFILSSHGTSMLLDDLDDKDELVRTIHRKQANATSTEVDSTPQRSSFKSEDFYNFHPNSILLPWDISRDDCVKLIHPSFPSLCREHDGTQDPLITTTSSHISSSSVAILKTPLGSRGEGVFFVTSVNEVYDLIESHQERARKEDGFLDMVRRWKGRIPSWVLQEEIYPPMLIRGNRKFHLRTYVAIVEHSSEEGQSQSGKDDGLARDKHVKVYIYNRHEVRIASIPFSTKNDIVSETSSEYSTDQTSRDRDAHITNGAGGDKTQRFLLQEVDELVSCGMQERIEKFVAEIFLDHVMNKDYSNDSHHALSVGAKSIPSRCSSSTATFHRINIFNFSGVDIMVDDQGKLYLLEVNVNPAAPPRDTVVGTTFHSHLVGVMSDLISLLISTTINKDGKEELYNFKKAQDILALSYQ